VACSDVSRHLLSMAQQLCHSLVACLACMSTRVMCLFAGSVHAGCCCWKGDGVWMLPCLVNYLSLLGLGCKALQVCHVTVASLCLPAMTKLVQMDYRWFLLHTIKTESHLSLFILGRGWGWLLGRGWGSCVTVWRGEHGV
jgi:hypothetical protein